MKQFPCPAGRSIDVSRNACFVELVDSCFSMLTLSTARLLQLNAVLVSEKKTCLYEVSSHARKVSGYLSIV